MTTPQWNDNGSNGQYDPYQQYGQQPAAWQQQPQPSYADASWQATLPPEQADTWGPPTRTEVPAQVHQPQPAEPARPAPRTGSPIIPPGLQPALLTVVLAALTAGTAAVARPALAVAVVLLQAVTAAGWFRLNGMWRARQGIALAFLAGVTADIALLAAPRGQAPAVIAGTLGVWIVLILVQQMRHRGSADERLSSLTATAASTVLTVLAAGCLATGGDPVIVGAAAVGAATLVRALPLPSPVTLVLALLAAAGAGIATGNGTALGAGTHTILLALTAGACALIGLRVASYDFPSRFVHFTAGVALPLAITSPILYVVARALGV